MQPEQALQTTGAAADNPAPGEVIPTKFVWTFGGRQVHVCGSFSAWVEAVPLAWEVHPEHPGGGYFAAVVPLAPGYHQFKYIVDNEWRHDPSRPHLPDPGGNLNNWVFLKRPDPSAPPQPGLGQPSVAPPNSVPTAATGGYPLGHYPPPPPPQTGSMDWQGQAANAAHAAAGLPPHAHAAVAVDPTLAAHFPGSPPAPPAPPPPPGVALEVTRRKVQDCLALHTAYELLPESGRVMVLDTALSVRRALHSLHDHGVSHAPLWDAAAGRFVGVMAASDFILVMHRLKTFADETGGALSDAEMDELTIAEWRVMRPAVDRAAAQARAALLTKHGFAPQVASASAAFAPSAAAGGGGGGGGGAGSLPPLVAVRSEDTLHTVAQALLRSGFDCVPVLSHDDGGALAGGGRAASGGGGADGDAPVPPHAPPGDTGGELLLHSATLPCLLAAVVRAFRSHTAALPLLSHPIELVRNQLGRWVAGLEPPSAASGALPPRGATSELRVATTDTPLPLVLAWLSEAEGPGSVPVVEPGTGALVDLYSRADILSLAHGSAYGALQSQWETSTVSHALSLAHGSLHSRAVTSSGLSALGGLDPTAAAAAAAGLPQAGMLLGGEGADLKAGDMSAARRPLTVTRSEPLQRIVDRLSLPGVRRVVVVNAATNAVEGLITDRDVAALLLYSSPNAGTG